MTQYNNVQCFQNSVHSIVLLLIALVLLCPTSLFGEDIMYFGPGNHDMGWPLAYTFGYSELQNYSDRDLRGSVIRIDMFDSGDVGYCDFSNADLRGLTDAGGYTRYGYCVFRNTNLSGVTFGFHRDSRDEISDFTDANISESLLHLNPKDLIQTKNYKEKDLSETFFPSYGNVDLTGFNLRNSYFKFGASWNALIFTDADIAGSTFQANPLTNYPNHKLGNPCTFSLSLDQLCSTKTYKERNFCRVIFIYMEFSNVDFRNQNLGYFDGCNLEGADLTNAYFVTRDERTLAPFARNNPIGVTDCNITVEQFKQTRNYKIWQDLGIPEVKKILITEDNKKEYRYDDELRPTILNLWFGRELPKNDEPQYVYKVGNVFVTKEIAEALDTERQIREKSP